MKLVQVMQEDVHTMRVIIERMQVSARGPQCPRLCLQYPSPALGLLSVPPVTRCRAAALQRHVPCRGCLCAICAICPKSVWNAHPSHGLRRQEQADC